MIIVVDGNSLIHTYWHIKPDAPDVVERFLTRLERLREHFMLVAQEQGYGKLRCYVAFDRERTTFRHQIIPEYKSGRTRDPDLDEAIDHGRESLQHADHWDRLDAPKGYEADDVMASVAAQSNDFVLLHTSDKDCNQCLIEGRVTRVKSSRLDLESRALNPDLYRWRDFEAEFWFPPTRWVDYQCMVGDGVDKVVGADGIGHVTASRILRIHGDIPLEEIEPVKLNKRQKEGWQSMQERLSDLRAVLTLKTDIAPEEMRKR